MNIRPPSSRKSGAAALAALMAMTSLLTLLHGAGHRHHYCAEHEAFEEAGDAAVSVVPSVAHALLTNAEPAPLNPDTADGEHELCPAANFGSRLGATPALPCVPVDVLVALPAPEPAPPPASPPVPLLAAAPKNSPPAA